MTSPVPVAACVVPAVATANAQVKTPDAPGDAQFGGEYNQAIASGAAVKETPKAEPARKPGDAKSVRGKAESTDAGKQEASTKAPAVATPITPPPLPPAPIFGFALGSLKGSDDLETLRELISPSSPKADVTPKLDAVMNQPPPAFGLRDLLPASGAGQADAAESEAKGGVAFTVKIAAPGTDTAKATAPATAGNKAQAQAAVPLKTAESGERARSASDRIQPAEAEPAKPAGSRAVKDVNLAPAIQAGAAYSASAETGTRPAAKIEAPAAVQEVGATEAAPASPAVRELTLKIGAADQAQATVHVREMAGGQVKVMVHTPNAELTNNLRSELEGLSSRLESAGVRASVTQPVAQSHAASGGSLEQRDSQSAGGRPADQSAAKDPEQGREQRRSKWLDEMEKRYADQ